MIGTINLPIALDDSAIRDELANLRLQASRLVDTVTAAATLLADVKAQGVSLSTSVATLKNDVLAAHEQLAQIQAELDVLRDMIPARKPTFVLQLEVDNKETA